MLPHIDMQGGFIRHCKSQQKPNHIHKLDGTMLPCESWPCLWAKSCNTGWKGPQVIARFSNSTPVPSRASQMRVLRASSYHFRATPRMSLWDRSPAHMPQSLTTLMAKTHFPNSPCSCCLSSQLHISQRRLPPSPLRPP